MGRSVYGPRELEALDRNLVGGAVNGGTAKLHQQFVFRPTLGLGRPETPVKNLLLARRPRTRRRRARRPRRDRGTGITGAAAGCGG